MHRIKAKVVASYNTFVPKLYSLLRLLILPMETIDEVVPKKGRIMDYGCGYGVTSAYLALSCRKRNILGIEKNKSRIKSINILQNRIQNLSFLQADITDMKIPNADAHLLIDVIHHIPYNKQTILLDNIIKPIRKNDLIILKEIDKNPFLKYLWNYMHDKIMTLNEDLFFNTKEWYMEFFKKRKMKLKIIDCQNILYSHFIIIARK